jgi:hypothetical protein
VAIVPGTVTVTSGANTTGFTLVINSGVLAGDVLLLGITNRDATANPTVVDNDTGGNTWLRHVTQNATTNGSISVWWKRATSATASKTITVSGCTGSASGLVMPYRGCLATGTPIGTAAGEQNASGNETQVEITTSVADAYVCLFVGCTSNDTLNPATFTATNPTVLTDRSEGISTGGSDCSLAHASARRTTAGATGALNWVQTDGTGASTAFELLPALNAYALACTGGSAAIAGADAGLRATRHLSAAAGSVALTGTSATLFRGYRMVAAGDSVALTGSSAGLRATRLLSASPGSTTLTGFDAGLRVSRLLSAQPGSTVLTGSSAGLLATRLLSADAGTLELTGTAAGLFRGLRLHADSGSITLTGGDATLTHEGFGEPELAHYTLDAAPGSFTLTGGSANLLHEVPMALGNKTLNVEGVLTAVGGKLVGTAGQMEDLIDSVSTLEASVAESVSRLLSVGPVAAKGTNNVHALHDAATAAFAGPFTNPDVPRNLRVVKSASWDGGTVTVVGTDQYDAAVSETFNADVETTVGVKIFKTVTSATKSIAAGVAGNGASIGTGDTIGLLVPLADEVGALFVGGAAEAVTLDDTYDSFVPTTTPSATTYLVLANVVLGS